MGFNSESQWEMFGECECGATVWEMNGKFNCPDCICGRDLEDNYDEYTVGISEKSTWRDYRSR